MCDPDPICDLQITSDFQRLILAVLTRTPETGVELSETETTLPDLSLSSQESTASPLNPVDSATYLPSASLTSSWRCRCRWLQCAERRYGCDRCDCALQSFVLAHVSPFFSLRCIAISTLGFVNQLPRRFRRTKRELSSSQSEYLSQTLFPSTVIPNIPSRLNHDSCFCCMMCKRSGGGAASQAETWPV